MSDRIRDALSWVLRPGSCQLRSCVLVSACACNRTELTACSARALIKGVGAMVGASGRSGKRLKSSFFDFSYLCPEVKKT